MPAYATPIQNAIQIQSAGQFAGNDGHYAVVPCADYDAYRDLPAGIEFEGREYGLTGWNSDTCNAYYRTSRKFARGK